MKKEDLVALLYEGNDSVSAHNLKDGCIEGLKLNLRRGTWDYAIDDPRLLDWKGTAIGKARVGIWGVFGPSPYNREGVIGVYDKANIDHINSMIRDAIQATRLYSGILS